MDPVNIGGTASYEHAEFGGRWLASARPAGGEGMDWMETLRVLGPLRVIHLAALMLALAVLIPLVVWAFVSEPGEDDVL